MQVENVLVEEILADEANRLGLAKSTLYGFRDSRWISYHREREGRRLGPITLLDDPEASSEPLEVSMRRFAERKLHTEESHRMIISYRDRWTIPSWTVYALVLPKGFVASLVRLVHQDPSHLVPELQVAVSKEARLFYHTIFAEIESRHVFDVEARIEQNTKRYEKLIKSAEVVSGTINYKRLRKQIGQEVMSSDFWFRLLELGGKLLPRP